MADFMPKAPAQADPRPDDASFHIFHGVVGLVHPYRRMFDGHDRLGHASPKTENQRQNS